MSVAFIVMVETNEQACLTHSCLNKGSQCSKSSDTYTGFRGSRAIKSSKSEVIWAQALWLLIFYSRTSHSIDTVFLSE